MKEIKKENVKTVAQSYQQRRRPVEKKIPPHVRYNPDTLNNSKGEKEVEM